MTATNGRLKASAVKPKGEDSSVTALIERLEKREVFVTNLLDAVLTHLDDDVRSYFEDGDLEESVIEDLQSYYDGEEFDKDFRQSMVEHLTY